MHCKQRSQVKQPSDTTENEEEDYLRDAQGNLGGAMRPLLL